MENKKNTITLVLIRHGISTSNESHHLVGWTDVPLSENGKEQLKKYRDEIQYPQVERFYTSDLQRAVMTFDILFKDRYTIYRTCPGLREVYFGKMENNPPENSEASRTFHEEWLKRQRIDDEETFDEFQCRVVTEFNEILQECRRDGISRCGIVLHEGSIRVFMMALEHREFADYRSLHVANGLGIILTLEVDDHSITLIEKSVIEAPEKKNQYFNLIMIRHGISEANEKHRMVGWTDVDLSPRGVAELESYRDTVQYPAAERFYSSDLLRARRTFEILFGDRFPLYEATEKLRENYYGIHEDCEVPIPSRTYFSTWLEQIPQGGEEMLKDFENRIYSAIKEIVKNCEADGLKSCAVVSHAGVIRILLILLQRRPYSDFMKIWAANGLGFSLRLSWQRGELKLAWIDEIKRPDQLAQPFYPSEYLTPKTA